MRTAEAYWIAQQLEPPNEIIRTGNHKRYKPIKDPFAGRKPDPVISEEEDNRRQDDYLKSKGVPC